MFDQVHGQIASHEQFRKLALHLPAHNAPLDDETGTSSYDPADSTRTGAVPCRAPRSASHFRVPKASHIQSHVLTVQPGGKPERVPREPVGHDVCVQVLHGSARLERRHRQRIARWLAWATIAWNTVEAVVAIAAGAAASSIALIGFGLDSTVEVLSASVIVWQMTRAVPEEREAQALRLIAVTFFALAGYVAVQAVFDLISHSEPESSTVGIALAAVSLVVMPTLAWLKHCNGRRLGSNSVVADSRQTMLCTYLSAVLLIGLLLNATVGWWWADPLAALVIAGLAFKEGREAWQGERCCDNDAECLTTHRLSCHNSVSGRSPDNRSGVVAGVRHSLLAASGRCRRP